jgi:hypothetical protein
MKRQVILIFAAFGLLVQCQDSKNEVKSRIEQIFAENIYDFGRILQLNIFSDSTYTFTVIEKSPDYEKTEKFKGLCFLKNDTIYFKPFKFEFNDSEKAIIKNGFVEFVNGKNPFKIEIKKNEFNTKSNLDFENYKDYAVFTFDQRFYSSTYYNYKPNTIIAYEIKQSELVEIDEILKKCFSANSSRLININDYVKQCIPVINSNQEKEVWISCYCKVEHIKKEYKYSIIQMEDGGKCNINLKINLTKHNYSQLNIAGEA